MGDIDSRGSKFSPAARCVVLIVRDYTFWVLSSNVKLWAWLKDGCHFLSIFHEQMDKDAWQIKS